MCQPMCVYVLLASHFFKGLSDQGVSLTRAYPLLHTLARAQAYQNTHGQHTYTHVQRHTKYFTHAHTDTRASMQTHAHTPTTHKYTHACTLTRTRIPPPPSLTRTHTHTHTTTHTHAHTHKNQHTCAHTSTQHTNTQAHTMWLKLRAYYPAP